MAISVTVAEPIISVAPMMDWTDRHCRYFHRLLTQNALLFTEMLTQQAVLKGDRNYLLGYDPSEHPVALQLGGNDPKQLAECAQIAESYGYDEINLNVGCPSDRVQAAQFGLALFKSPEVVAECIEHMQKAVSFATPVTVKTRIGVDDLDTYEDLHRFITVVSQVGCQRFYIHARKGWLKGLSPKENRTIPPLDYQRVYQLKSDFPHLHIGLNGGVETLSDAKMHLQYVDSVMLGRAAYHNPYLLAEVDSLFYGQADNLVSTRYAVVEKLHKYLQSQMCQGVKAHAITRHILGLFQGEPGAKRWRQFLSCGVQHHGATVLTQALKEIEKITAF